MVGEPEPDHRLLAGTDPREVAGRQLGAGGEAADGIGVAVHHEVVDAVLDARSDVLAAPQPGGVGLVLREEEGRRAPAQEPAPDVARVVDLDGQSAFHRLGRPEARPALVDAPGPGVAEPQRGQEVERGGLGAAVDGGHPHQDVFRRGLGVLDDHVEVPVLVEQAGLDQLVLELAAVPASVLLEEPAVGELGLRVLVDVPHVAVARGVVDVEVVLLAVLPVVSLVAGQAEQPLLQDRIAAVPHGEGQADEAVAVGKPGDAILTPAVDPGASLVVVEVFPRGAALAVVFPHRAPLPLRQVGPPAPPVGPTGVGLGEPPAFGGVERGARRAIGLVGHGCRRLYRLWNSGITVSASSASWSSMASDGPAGRRTNLRPPLAT